MKGYEEYFSKISDGEWENFAVDVLCIFGFSLIVGAAYGPDGGKDALVEKDGIKYIVSCKHYINSGNHVGVSDEMSIIDRIVHHGATGFIGFYSTSITNTLQYRLYTIDRNGNPCIVFDKYRISNIMPLMEQRVTFKYGADKSKFYMNVNQEQYKPLKCMECGKDLLSDSMIDYSLAGIIKNSNDEWEYIFACKGCLNKNNIEMECDVEINQVLHLEEINNWNSYIDEFIDEEKV